jgi:RimJ/RimL family protein N-acetyltransferase
MSTPNLFTGNRLRLAPAQPEDIAIIAQWSLDSEFARQSDTDFARPLSAQETTDREAMFRSGSNCVSFRLRTLANDRLIGYISLHSIEWNNQTAILSIGIGEAEYRDKGYGSEALQLILHYAFNELNLHRVGLDVISTNARGIRAYEKVGFQHEGVLRQSVYRDGVRVDQLVMGILRPEWQALHNPQELQ